MTNTEQIIQLAQMGLTAQQIDAVIGMNSNKAEQPQETVQQVEHVDAPQTETAHTEPQTPPQEQPKQDDSKLDALLAQIGTLTTAIQTGNMFGAFRDPVPVRTMEDINASIINPNKK